MGPEDFARLGIDIDPSCNIANSTLKELIKNINSALSPDQDLSPESEIFLRGAKIGEPGQRIAEDLIESKEKLNFNIKIEAGVIIGENVYFGSSVSIGEETNIGDNVAIHTGTEIGKHCKVGSGVLFGNDCIIGDNTDIQKSTAFMGKTHVPFNSRVVHENTDNSMAKIEPKFKIVNN